MSTFLIFMFEQVISDKSIAWFFYTDIARYILCILQMLVSKYASFNGKSDKKH